MATILKFTGERRSLPGAPRRMATVEYDKDVEIATIAEDNHLGNAISFTIGYHKVFLTEAELKDALKKLKDEKPELLRAL